MTDKERLKKIKALLERRDQHIDEEGQINYHEYDKVLYKLNYQGHIDWLYQQAERVEELEKVEYALQETYRQEREYNKKLEEQNKRYRKAINNIIEKAMWFGTNEEVYEAIQDAIKELEGEK